MSFSRWGDLGIYREERRDIREGPDSKEGDLIRVRSNRPPQELYGVATRCIGPVLPSVFQRLRLFRKRLNGGHQHRIGAPHMDRYLRLPSRETESTGEIRPKLGLTRRCGDPQQLAARLTEEIGKSECIVYVCAYISI